MASRESQRIFWLQSVVYFAELLFNVESMQCTAVRGPFSMTSSRGAKKKSTPLLMYFHHGRKNPGFPSQQNTRYSRFPQPHFRSTTLRHQLDDTTGLGDLLLSQLADVPGADDDRDLGEAALAEDLGVAEGEEVEDGGGVLLGAGDVGVAGLGGDEGPELVDVYRGGPEMVLPSTVRRPLLVSLVRGVFGGRTYLLLVEVPHSHLTEVSVMVFLLPVSASFPVGLVGSVRLASMLVRWWC